MTICCRVDDRQTHHRLRHIEASTESGLTARQLGIPGRIQRSSREDFSKRAGTRDQQGFRSLAGQQGRELPYLAQVSSRFPLIHSVQFGPLPLQPSCHPGQDFGLKDPRSPGRFRGPSPFPIDPTSLECAMPHLCRQTARLYGTVQCTVQTTGSQWLAG